MLACLAVFVSGCLPGCVCPAGLCTSVSTHTRRPCFASAARFAVRPDPPSCLSPPRSQEAPRHGPLLYSIDRQPPQHRLLQLEAERLEGGQAGHRRLDRHPGLVHPGVDPERQAHHVLVVVEPVRQREIHPQQRLQLRGRLHLAQRRLPGKPGLHLPLGHVAAGAVHRVLHLELRVEGAARQPQRAYHHRRVHQLRQLGALCENVPAAGRPDPGHLDHVRLRHQRGRQRQLPGLQEQERVRVDLRR